MRKVAVVALCCALLGSSLLAAQKQSPASGKKIETLFKAAEIPFTSSEEGSYVAVITVEEGESDRFHVYLSSLGNDPNNEKLQIVQLYFLLGALPKASPVPITGSLRAVSEAPQPKECRSPMLAMGGAQLTPDQVSEVAAYV